MNTPVTRELFLQTLMRHLVLWKNSDQDVWNADRINVLEVFQNCVQSLESGTYSRRCAPIKSTCKELKIKCTRESIDSIFKPITTGVNHEEV